MINKKTCTFFITALLTVITGCTRLFPVSPGSITTAAPAQPMVSATHARTPAKTATLETAPPTATTQPAATLPPAPTATQTARPPLVFAVIGDFGTDGKPEADIAALVKSWHPAFIITTGDNNNPIGAAETIDRNIGKYYHAYIYNYHGKYGQGADQLRFFPALGNHDWTTRHAIPYLDYFTLPGNERYYDFVWGPVHFFALDSDSREPDGVSASSVQARWLKKALAQAEEPWKIVYMHHPPYSSGKHGSTDWMQWPFQAWGASLVLSGHDHVYERIMREGFPYITIGASGIPSLYNFVKTVPGSVVRYRRNYGALRIEATPAELTIEFINRDGEIIDRFTLTAPAP